MTKDEQDALTLAEQLTEILPRLECTAAWVYEVGGQRAAVEFANVVAELLRAATAKLREQHEELKKLDGSWKIAHDFQETTIEALRRERDDEQAIRIAEVENWVTHYNEVEAWRVQLSVENATLRAEHERLKDYVQHGDGCPAWPQFTSHFQQATKIGACTCGLAAALAGDAEGGER